MSLNCTAPATAAAVVVMPDLHQLATVGGLHPALPAALSANLITTLALSLVLAVSRFCSAVGVEEGEGVH